MFKDCQIKSEESKEVTKIFEDIKKYSCLFNFEEKLEKIFNLTREIQKENKEKNKDKNKIQKLKKERGENLKSFSNLNRPALSFSSADKNRNNSIRPLFSSFLVS